MDSTTAMITKGAGIVTGMMTAIGVMVDSTIMTTVVMIGMMAIAVMTGHTMMMDKGVTMVSTMDVMTSRTKVHPREFEALVMLRLLFQDTTCQISKKYGHLAKNVGGASSIIMMRTMMTLAMMRNLPMELTLIDTWIQVPEITSLGS
jgi:hypothetical protein